MKKVLFSVFLIILTVVIPAFISAATFNSNSANIKNTYLPSKIGFSVLHTSFGMPSTQFEYTHVVGIEKVDGVNCIRIIKLTTQSSEFEEVWIAQDVNGDIYVLKQWDAAEDPAPVELGVAGAILIIPKNPEVGDKLFGGWETVTHTGVTVPQLSTGLGPFDNCIQTIDGDDDIYYYAPDYAEVKIVYEGGSVGWELKYIFNPKPNTVVIPLF